jgi:hypothetical protein
MWPRRRFLQVAVGGGVACVGGFAGWRYATATEEDAIVAVLRRRLHFLRLDPPGLQAFAAALVARGVVSGHRLRLIAAAGALYRDLPVRPAEGVLAKELQHGEERVVSLYMLSSDFFVNGADEARSVRYLAFYDPLVDPRGCANPFARPMEAS